MLDIADEAIGSRGVYSTLLIEDYRLINDRHLAKKRVVTWQEKSSEILTSVNMI